VRAVRPDAPRHASPRGATHRGAALGGAAADPATQPVARPAGPATQPVARPARARNRGAGGRPAVPVASAVHARSRGPRHAAGSSPVRRALLATGAAGLVAVPLGAAFGLPSPVDALAVAGIPAPARTVDLDASLAAYQSATDSAVATQMAAAAMQTAAEQRVSAEQAAADAATRAAETAAAQAAAQRAADERAAAERASRSRAAAPAAVAASGDPRAIARSLLAARGQSSQFSCLDQLWNRESGWSTSADNPASSAYGIPQALPGSKMASAGADWRTNPATQITWGLSYIASRYGSPCGAWSHSQSNGWY